MIPFFGLPLFSIHNRQTRNRIFHQRTVTHTYNIYGMGVKEKSIILWTIINL